MTNEQDLPLVVNAFPDVLAQRYAAGNWKDIRGFQALLDAAGTRVMDIGYDLTNPEDLIERIPESTNHVVVHYSFSPELVAAIRQHLPDARVHVRVHNAEALQHWHRNMPGTSSPFEWCRAVYAVARLAWRDARCRHAADSILGISDWDNAHYWRRLPGRAPVLDVPYHCPWPALLADVVPEPWEARRRNVVSLPGGRDRLGRSQVENLARMGAESSRARREGWSFEVTSGIFPTAGRDEASLISLEQVDEPWALLCRSRVYALLSPLGFGFKTTVLDALAAGCHVVVERRLAARMHPRMRQYCHVRDCDGPLTIDELLPVFDAPPEPRDVAEAFRQMALDALRTLVR